MLPSFADPAETAIALDIVTEEDLGDYLEGSANADWLRALGFAASTGEVAMIPGPDGAPVRAIAGIGNARAAERGRFLGARIAAALPEGRYKVQNATERVNREELALGWLLGGYRFDRYHAAQAQAARLVAPEGVDAARIAIIAEGEALTRGAFYQRTLFVYQVAGDDSMGHR